MFLWILLFAQTLLCAQDASDLSPWHRPPRFGTDESSGAFNPAPWGKITYKLTPEPIDVVIPCSPKDLETLELCIQGLKDFAINIRRIIIISETRLTESAEWIPETIFPFSRKDIASEIFSEQKILANR